MEELDFDAAYKVVGHLGIAWHAIEYQQVIDEDYEWSGIKHDNREKVVCVMIGDDSKFTFDVTDLTKLDEEEYCPGCGQIGCKAYG